MASNAEIKREAFGRSVEDISISSGPINGDVLLRCGWKYVRFTWLVKSARNRRVVGARYWMAFLGQGSDLRNKKAPATAGALTFIGLQLVIYKLNIQGSEGHW